MGLCLYLIFMKSHHKPGWQIDKIITTDWLGNNEGKFDFVYNHKNVSLIEKYFSYHFVVLHNFFQLKMWLGFLRSNCMHRCYILFLVKLCWSCLLCIFDQGTGASHAVAGRNHLFQHFKFLAWPCPSTPYHGRAPQMRTSMKVIQQFFCWRQIRTTVP